MSTCTHGYKDGTDGGCPFCAPRIPLSSKKQTLDQLHAAYSKFCAWTHDEETEYMGMALEREIIEAMLAAARAIDRLPDDESAPETEGRRGPSIHAICVAYESGMGQGLNKNSTVNPYASGDLHIAYDHGWREGQKRRAEKSRAEQALDEMARINQETGQYDDPHSDLPVEQS